MIKKFAVTNYRGFASKIEFNLSNPRRYDFNAFAIDNGVVKNGIIYGPNGCGKTNLGLAIFDIVNHLTQRKKMDDYYDNFVYAGNSDQSVDFEYSFVFGNQSVEYAYSKSREGSLLKETLIVDGHLYLNHDEVSLEIHDPQIQIPEVVRNKILSNSVKISVINNLLMSFPLDDSHPLVRLQHFVDSMLWFRCLDDRRFMGLDNQTTNLMEFIINNNLVESFKNFIYDVSAQEFEFAAPENEEKILYCLIDGKKLEFLKLASTGTISLLLLFYWVNRMSEASFVFIDEFDAFYHFKLSFNVCKLLFEQNCQVFLSSHNTYLMTNDLLRPDCNFIIANNEIKPLCDCTQKDLQFGHNIEKMFRTGAFN